MCEYCGCQQIAVIDELTREHDAVVTILGSIREVLAAGHLDAAAAHCRELLAVLGPHTVVEEEGLFPELSGEYPDHVVTLRAEHREIEHVLAEAVDGPPLDPTWPTRLQQTAFLLREHILKEQDGVFPAALSALDSDQWERVERVRARAGSPLAVPAVRSRA